MSKKKPVTILAFDDEVGDGDELPDGKELGNEASVTATAFFQEKAMTAELPVTSKTTGDAILALAKTHVSEPYILGARAPMSNPNWKGPWDCAEFVSWCVYQSTGILFGTRPRNNPVLADAYTGYWYEQAAEAGAAIDWREAANIAGAPIVRRATPGQIGHIVLSDGQGGTVEAHSKVRGVIISTLSGRRWDCGVLVPGIQFLRSDSPMVPTEITGTVLRVTHPLMSGDRVRKLQERLAALKYPIGSTDGIYGPQMAFAVRLFQARNGLVADGEAGAVTEKLLLAAT